MRNNKSVLGVGIITAVLAITGCGGSDDNGVYQSGGNGGQNGNGPIVNKAFQYTSFEMYNDKANSYKSAWGKLKYTWRESGITEEISTVVGKTPFQDIHNTLDKNSFDYYVGNNTFIAIAEPDFKQYFKFKVVDSDTFKLTQTKDKSSLTSVFDVLTYDLNGKGKISDSAMTGIDTDLNAGYFPNDVKFPKGSVCYQLQETPVQSYYYFYTGAARDKLSIDQWLKLEPNNTYYALNGKPYHPVVKNVVKEQIGQNNSLPAVHYKDQYGQYHAAVQFNGMLYTADYYEKGVKETMNTDPNTSRVECWMYNDIAADYLEQQIKANYK